MVCRYGGADRYAAISAVTRGTIQDQALTQRLEDVAERGDLFRLGHSVRLLDTTEVDNDSEGVLESALAC